MPRPRNGGDPLAAAEAFAGRLQTAPTAPSINRYVPQPQQDPFHRSQQHHRAVRGGNRGGKTFATTADDVLIALRRHPHRQHFYPDQPLKMRVITIDFDRGIAQNIVPLWRQMLPPSALVNGNWEDSYHAQTHLLMLADGTVVSFMSYEQGPDKFQAVPLHHIHFDEEPPLAIWQESQMRLLDYDGTMTVSMTPVQQSEWLQDQVIEPALDGRLPDWEVFDFDTEANVHVSQRAVAAIAATLSDEERAVRLHGQYTASNMVFPEFKLAEPFVVPMPGFAPRPDDGWAIYESMDHGYANPTAWLWTAVHEDGSIITFRELYAARVPVAEWILRVQAMRREIGELLGVDNWRPNATFGDPSIARAGESAAASGMSIQQLYAAGGVNIGTMGIVAARTGNQNVGLDKMHTYLRLRPDAAGPSPRGVLGDPWWQITTDCPNLASEVRRARLPKQSTNAKLERNQSEQIRDKDNHAIDAQKYLFIPTSDLRPLRFRDQDRSAFHLAERELMPAPPMVTQAESPFRATITEVRSDVPADPYGLEW